MVERLGNVIYWAASGFALLIISLALYGFFFGNTNGDHAGQIMFLAFAFIVWLCARGIRYVLSGR